MKIILTSLKALMLTGLVVISIMQISKLWFDDDSDRNFFYSVIPNEMLTNSREVKDLGNLLEPEQLAVFLSGGSEYTVIRKGAQSYDNALAEVIEILRDSIKSSNYQDIVEDMSILWKNQHVLLRLPISYSHRLIEDNLMLQRNSLDKIDFIQTIIIVPVLDNDKEMRIYIENGMDKLYHEYRVDVDNVELSNEVLVHFVKEIAQAQLSTDYVSTLKNNIVYFDDNVLIPNPSENIKYHDKLYMSSPFVQSGQKDTEAIESYVGHFYNNPEIIDASPLDGVILYSSISEENVKVRYLDNGLIHYKKSLTNEPAYADVSSAISAASRFIHKDTQLIPGEYYLKDYTIDDGYVKLYYGMFFNDFELVLSNELKNEYRLEKPYPMVVTVSEDEVIEYKRILSVVDESLPQDRTMEAKFGDALDAFIEEIGRVDVIIDDVFLGYGWNNLDSELELHWMIESSDKLYSYEIP